MCAETLTGERAQPGFPARVVALCGGIVTIGGAEKMIFSALRLLRDHGSAVHCIVNDWENEAVAAEAEAIGATWSAGHHREPLRWRNRSASQVLKGIGSTVETSRKMLQDVWRIRPSLIFVADFGEVVRNASGLAILRARGVPVILYLQNSPPDTTRHRRLFRLLVDPLVTRYVVASLDSKATLVSHGVARDKISYVNNFALSEASEESSSRDPKRVLFVGQIIPQKGLDVLLEAFALVAASDSDVRLDIAGRTDGWIAPEYASHRDGVLARAEHTDLRGKVTFLGWRDDIPALLRGAQVHCAPSRPEMHEGMPLVCLEAKTAGTPTVAPAIGPFPELIQHRVDGWLCAALSPASLAEGLRYFLNDAEAARKAGDAALVSSSRFSRAEFDRRWKAVFVKVVPGAGLV